MKLITLQNYLENRFDRESRPDPRTIKTLIDNGVICGKRLGRTYYLEVDPCGREIESQLQGLFSHG
jgi:hypothetical protein